jgi:L-seryl-tRNA(Ser) seleniumtransferase
VQSKTNPTQSILRSLPAVHEALDWTLLKRAETEGNLPRWVLRQAVRDVLDRHRDEILRGDRSKPESREGMEKEILDMAHKLAQRSLRPVVNATGVLLHTNLGRAPLAREAVRALEEVAAGYSNLEFNLETGKRGLRYEHVEGLLCQIAGAESALVVNNNAAAVYLALRVLAKGKEVIVSRGELIEIGGSFRIPDILRESGAYLVEVGTTNRTHLTDYERAVGSSTGLLLKVHPSNYRVMGFHKEVSTAELVTLGRRYSLPVMEDLGSGCFVEAGPAGLMHEPLVAEVLRTGVDLVTFSGDKLLGGPQAGILLGREEVLRKIQAHPLNRVLRIDKLTLAALEVTLLLHRDPQTVRKKIPTLAMLSATVSSLRRRANQLAKQLGQRLPSSIQVSVRSTTGRTGGGSMPMDSLPGVGVLIRSSDFTAEEILARLRRATPPVIARIEQDEVILDLRTLQRGEDRLIVKALENAFAES